MRALRVAVVGSRDYPRLFRVRQFVRSLPAGTVVVSGGARGVDEVAEQAARKRGLRVKIFYPDYEKYGRRSFAIRNRKIVNYADKIAAFWDGASPGTEMTIGFAKEFGKPVEIFRSR